MGNSAHFERELKKKGEFETWRHPWHEGALLGTQKTKHFVWMRVS